MKKPEYVMVGGVQVDKNALPSRSDLVNLIRNTREIIFLDDAEEKANAAVNESGLYPIEDIEATSEPVVDERPELEAKYKELSSGKEPKATWSTEKLKEEIKKLEEK